MYELTPRQKEYFDDLTEWVFITFRCSQNLNTLFTVFNYHFPFYQKNFDKKMDLAEIKDGYIDCSMAVLIAGIWWTLQNCSKPEYMVDLREAGAVKKYERHALLALPLITLASKSALDAELYKPVRSVDVIDYVYSEEATKSHKNGLGIATDKRIPEVYTHFSGNLSFIKNRFETFKYLQD